MQCITWNVHFIVKSRSQSEVSVWLLWLCCLEAAEHAVSWHMKHAHDSIAWLLPWAWPVQRSFHYPCNPCVHVLSYKKYNMHGGAYSQEACWLFSARHWSHWMFLTLRCSCSLHPGRAPRPASAGSGSAVLPLTLYVTAWVVAVSFVYFDAAHCVALLSLVLSKFLANIFM